MKVTLTELNLPEPWKSQVEQIIYNNRMNYDLWIESAVSTASFIESLRKRGFSNIPMSLNPMIKVPNERPNLKTNKMKTMIRKN